jgi:1-phosphofructokinase/tagatose 6-phosphate kinase
LKILLKYRGYPQVIFQIGLILIISLKELEMILTVTPNAALDRIEILPSLIPGKVLRSSTLRLFPGGKGVNVARAVKNLGGQPTCAGFLGGYSGRLLAELLEDEGIPATWTWIEGETRAAIVIVDETSGEATVINEEGPAVTSTNWERLHADVLKLAKKAEAVCLSGSLPLGSNPDAYAELVGALNQAGRRVWLDSSGATLRAAVRSHPAVLKVNGVEAADLLGWQEIEDVSTAVQAAVTLQQGGISQVVLTLGKLGAVLASEAGAWYSSPPDLKVICSVGSGDAFLGGLVKACLNGTPEPESLRQAVAAGSANSLSVGGGHFTHREFEAVLAETVVKKLA